MKRYAKIAKNENELLVKTAGFLRKDNETAPEGCIEITPEQEIKLNNGYYIKNLDTMDLAAIPTHMPTEEERLAAVKQPKLAELQNYLDSTDYEAIKYAEGELTAEEYASTKALRASWRTAYNSIQTAATIEEVEAITYEKMADK